MERTDERNALAEENERIRKEKAEEMRLRSQKAIDRLVESRKRRRNLLSLSQIMSSVIVTVLYRMIRNCTI